MSLKMVDTQHIQYLYEASSLYHKTIILPFLSSSIPADSISNAILVLGMITIFVCTDYANFINKDEPINQVIHPYLGSEHSRGSLHGSSWWTWPRRRWWVSSGHGLEQRCASVPALPRADRLGSAWVTNHSTTGHRQGWSACSLCASTRMPSTGCRTWRMEVPN